ncbi:unnamed protein product, partial [Pylaiella littoralis]
MVLLLSLVVLLRGLALWLLALVPVLVGGVSVSLSVAMLLSKIEVCAGSVRWGFSSVVMRAHTLRYVPVPRVDSVVEYVFPTVCFSHSHRATLVFLCLIVLYCNLASILVVPVPLALATPF